MMIFFAALRVILTGFLVRADGWGPAESKWQRISSFFNAWSCSAIFAVISAFTFSPIVALGCGASFLIFRFPGFNGWEDWLEMYWRGFWTSFIGFTIISLAAYGLPYWGLLSIPFATTYMLIYSGGYAWLPERILGVSRHSLIEHASGWAFRLSILIILGA